MVNTYDMVNRYIRLERNEWIVPNFDAYKVSHKVKVSCAPCLKGNHKDCTPQTPIKKVTCQCAFQGHKDIGGPYKN